jgi:hypothetical protein
MLSVAIIIIIVLTPLIIKSSISIVPEEVLEVIVIALLFEVGYFLLKLYRKEVKRNLEANEVLQLEKINLEERLMNAFKYIGSVNVQIDEIKSAFSDIKKYPESRQDFKYIMQFLGNKVLSMADTDWVRFRIIDTTNMNTLREYSDARGAAVLSVNKLSNKTLLENNSIPGCVVIKSTQENFSIKTFCIIKSNYINKDQEVLLKAIVNQLEMLFLMLASNYYRDTNDGNIINKNISEKKRLCRWQCCSTISIMARRGN